MFLCSKQKLRPLARGAEFYELFPCLWNDYCPRRVTTFMYYNVLILYTNGNNRSMTKSYVMIYQILINLSFRVEVSNPFCHSGHACPPLVESGI